MRAILTFIALASTVILSSCLALPSYARAQETLESVEVVDKLIQAVGKLSDQYGEKVVNLTLEAVRWNAISLLIIGTSALFLSWFLLKKLGAIVRRKEIAMSRADGDYTWGEVDALNRVQTAVTGAFCVSSVVALYTWVIHGVNSCITVFDPTLGLAMRVVSKFL